jgi:hypothetical protein
MRHSERQPPEDGAPGDSVRSLGILDQFVIFLLAAFSVMLCVIFGMDLMGHRSQKIPLLTLIAAALAVVVPILLFIPQLERWNTEDQPQVEAKFVEWADGLLHWPPRAVPPTAEPGNKYIFAVFNTGKEDTVEVKIKILGIDFLNAHHELLISKEYPRLKRGDPARLVTTTTETIMTTSLSASNTSIEEP